MSLRLKLLPLALFVLATQLCAADIWGGPAFSADPESLRQAAASIKAEKDSPATVLLNEWHIDFDESGRLVKNRRLIYRIETQDGVENWAESSGRWEAWHQSRPEIKARVVTVEGTVHWLDPNTLNDVPVHQDAPDLYGDERRYAGPLPAIAIGSIVEEQIITRETAPLFAAGSSYRWNYGWNVPVNKSRFVLTHPVSLPITYRSHMFPEAGITKSTQGGMETINFELNSLAAYTEDLKYVPKDVILFPEIEFSTGSSWQKLAAEYARMTEDKLRQADVQSLLTKIDLKKSSKRDDTIRSIVALLHKNVRYTGVEFGESSLIPQFPAETLKRKYGDCKDKAALLATMLRSAGIPAYLALVDTDEDQELNPELPGMGMFDHAIVYVPGSGSDPDFWIDATAQYSQVGILPWMDYGRWALIISDKTDSLKRIPELTSAQNVHKESREFTMADYGPAKIVEIDEDSGPGDADNRDYYSGDGKEIRENSEKYVKDMYLADSLTSLDHNDLSDLSKPAQVKFVTKGKRGGTDLNSATMAIRVEGLFYNFPNYFGTSKEQEKVKEGEDSEKQKPRTVDWQITPFTSEWQYKILAPTGFKLRAIPPDKNLKDGGLTFTQHYSSNPEGTVVEAALRVENTNTRLTVQQAEALREVVVKERNVDPIFITFDHLGHSLLAAGKVKEGLAAYQQIVAQHPKDAIHKAQFAQALLTAGLGEEARKVAKEATALDPNSAVADSTLGNVLKHDLIGRLLKKGMDFDGAVNAYKKSIALDPKETDTRANLALMLEYNTEGIRYGDHAPLKEAVQVLRDLKKLDEDYERTYEDNLLYDLWYARDYQGALDYASTLPTNPTRKGLTLGAIAALQGSDAALKKSLEITTDDHERSNALVSAGNVLLRVRKYQECAALMAAGVHGQNNEAQVARSAAIYAKTKPYEEIKFEPTDPRGVVHKVMGDLLSGKLTQEEGEFLIYNFASTVDEKQYKQMMTQLKLQLGASGLPLTTIADIAMSNMRYTVDGDDSVGYKIILEGTGAAPQNMYVVREGNQYQIAGFSTNTQTSAAKFAPFILRDIEKNDLTSARKWLDRARDEIHMSSGDDPLSGQPFPYFWTKGQEADASEMRTAALVLLESKEVKEPYLSALLQARDVAKSDADRNRLTLVIASAYAAQEKWTEMLEPVEQLMKAAPSSIRAFSLAIIAYKGLRQYDKWEKVAQEAIAKYPDEPVYVRASYELASYRGQFEKSREIIKSLLDKGQGTGDDMNQYAWYALLMPGPIDQASLDYAQRANDLTKNESFAILHTLACLDAAAGKTSQAHELLLKAMDALHIEEPNSEIWFGLASIAEQYGVVDAATTMYGRVEKPKVGYPGTSYVIAQRHLVALTGKPNVVAKSGNQ